ncbi:MAG: aldehyde dehydrogenase family protein, partial [Candidatus Eremiobacteraeota bacterium]|nr:aldehyde dehydrogenase family protein [Candidatus Eremiobacteraeota bacterium]
MATVLERTSEFKNEPLIDFKDSGNRQKMEAALAAVRADGGKTYDLIINGQRVRGQSTFQTRNPAMPSEILGTLQKASPAQAREAVAAAEQAFLTWSKTPAAQRADVLFKAADEVRKRRFEFDALLVLEVGKSWNEAEGDVAEGIDFLEYYAREMLRLAGPHPVTPVPGEKNAMVYIPLGVGVVIPPWNFAFAIMAGMTSAAIVTGNTVVLKPSSDSPLIAYKFVELLGNVGMPPGVVNLITGSGGEIGDLLVQHPRVRFVSFTGSKEVGLHINQLAATPQPGQIWIKRVVAEMGGKDSIVVAADADLDQAVEGVAVSAFGFGGQKCSACSRAIVEAPVYDEFVKRLKARVATINVDDPADPGTYMGPVINEGSLKKIQSDVEEGKKGGTLVAGGGRGEGEGYFMEPTVIADVKPDA